MGAYSPTPAFTPEVERIAMARIVAPVLDEMRARGTPYAGVLYIGLMLTQDGPKVIEFNARFGDPECQCILPRLETDLLPLLLACADGSLSHQTLAWKSGVCLTVVIAARGYPGTYGKGDEIGGLDKAAAIPDTSIFHAGTASEDGVILSNGGRVLGVTAQGQDIAESRARAYDAVERIDWSGGFCRSDIGWRALSE